MDFSYDDEQVALRDAVRGLVGKAYADFDNRRRTVAEDPGYDETLWARMAEMGLLGLPFAEDHGGMGAGPVETAIVCQELGRVIAPEPYLTSIVLAGGLIADAGTDEQRTALLSAVAEGETLLACAHTEPGRGWSAGAEQTRAAEEGGQWRLTGVKEPVPHGGHADQLILSAALPDAGTGLFLVASDDVARSGYSSYDGSRLARVELDGTPATPLGAAVDRTDVIGHRLDLTRIMAANQALGAMRVCLSATTDYLKSRKQFGVTLNTFQALNFRAADMYVSLELTQSLVDWATMVADSGDRAAIADAATRAALQVSTGSRHVGQEAIQLHGGIGMTAEYAVGNFVAHLTMLDHLLDNGSTQLRRLADTVTEHSGLDPLDAGLSAARG